MAWRYSAARSAARGTRGQRARRALDRPDRQSAGGSAAGRPVREPKEHVPQASEEVKGIFHHVHRVVRTLQRWMASEPPSQPVVYTSLVVVHGAQAAAPLLRRSLRSVDRVWRRQARQRTALPGGVADPRLLDPGNALHQAPRTAAAARLALFRRGQDLRRQGTPTAADAARRLLLRIHGRLTQVQRAVSRQ